jgi:hypothetical protein
MTEKELREAFTIVKINNKTIKVKNVKTGHQWSVSPSLLVKF